MKLKDIIDTNTFTPPLVQLQQRTWLMHWALFVFFNHDNGRNAIIDLFLSDRQGPPGPHVCWALSWGCMFTKVSVLLFGVLSRCAIAEAGHSSSIEHRIQRMRSCSFFVWLPAAASSSLTCSVAEHCYGLQQPGQPALMHLISKPHGAPGSSHSPAEAAFMNGA